MAVYKIIGTFGNSFSNSDQINLFVNSGAIVPSTTTKFQLEQGIFVTVDSGVTITAYTSNGTCANISDAVDVPNTPVPEPTEEFNCNTPGLNLVINNGEAGEAVTGTVGLGTIGGFTPTHYDANVTTYSASINIPSGYSNTGDGNQYISCEVDSVTVGLTNGWRFTAQTKAVGGINGVGFHQGTLLTDSACTSPAFISMGVGVSPTTATTDLPGTNCYVSVIGSMNTSKGYGINGVGNVSSFALTQFSFFPNQNVAFGIINTSGTGNPGSGSLSGTITGTDGSSGTWAVSYSASSSYVDNNGTGNTLTPESVGTVVLSGLTLTSGVTYTLST